MKDDTGVSLPEADGRKRQVWYGFLALVCVGMTVWLHTRWTGMKAGGLHAVPTFFWTAIALLVVDGCGAAAVGLARPPRAAFAWLGSASAWRGGLWRIAFLVTLAVLFYSTEFWRGRRAWARIQTEAAERGDTVATPMGEPGAVPAAQNLAEIPLFAPVREVLTKPTDEVEDALEVNLGALEPVRHWNQGWFGGGSKRGRVRFAPWRFGQTTDFVGWLHRWPGTHQAGSRPGEVAAEATGETWSPGRPAAEEVLRRLRPFEADLDQLRSNAERSYCRFALDYPRQMWRQNHPLVLLIGFQRILQLRACALLEVGRDEEALQDVYLAVRLFELSGQQPWALAGLQRWWVGMEILQPVWEALETHRWSGPQVADLQRRLAGIDVLKEYPAHVRNDAHAMADLLEAFLPATPGPARVPTAQRRAEDGEWILSGLRFVFPTGWCLQDQAALHWHYLTVTRDAIDVKRRVLGPRRSGRDVLISHSSDPVFATFVVPKAAVMGEDAALGAAAVQTAFDHAVVACGLDRHRRDRGAFPETLTALGPDLLPRLPHDIVTGNAMSYRVAGDGYALYSVGGNRVDDGGRSEPRSEVGAPRLDEGDWVWALEPREPTRVRDEAVGSPAKQ